MTNCKVDKGTIGKNISHYIKMGNLTIEKTAELMGVQPRTVYSWISGRSLPANFGLVRLAEILNVDVEYLLLSDMANRELKKIKSYKNDIESCMGFSLMQLRLMMLYLPLLDARMFADFTHRCDYGLHYDPIYFSYLLTTLIDSIQDSPAKRFVDEAKYMLIDPKYRSKYKTNTIYCIDGYDDYMRKYKAILDTWAPERVAFRNYFDQIDSCMATSN